MFRIKPWIKIKVGDKPEVNPCELIQGLTFLGDATAPTLTNNYAESAGQDGGLFNNATFSKTTVNANFRIMFADIYDVKLAKHDIYRLFMTKELIRIRTSSEPAIVKFVRAGNFDITPSKQGARGVVFTIPFENPSGYKYSYLTSDNPYLYETEGWQIGMNLPNGQNLHYQFTTPQMRVYNASDIAVDPYFQRHELKIICRYRGSFLRLENRTNGTSWQITKNSDLTEITILDGINTAVGGEPASRYTDYGNLVLEPGWNDIVAKGAAALDVTFRFPFIYIG